MIVFKITSIVMLSIIALTVAKIIDERDDDSVWQKISGMILLMFIVIPIIYIALS